MDLLLIASLAFIITFVGIIIFAWQWFWQVLFCMFPTLFLFIASLDFRFSVFVSLEKLDSLDDESDDYGYGSRFSGTCSFTLCFDDSIGCFSGLGYWVFVPTGVDFKCDVFVFVVFVPIGVKYKGRRLIEMLWISNSWFPSIFKNKFYRYSNGITLPHSFRPLSLHQKNDPMRSNGINLLALESW